LIPNTMAEVLPDEGNLHGARWCSFCSHDTTV
jgi:hypothetical protein